ncbi:hypothetical protein FQZ97_657760 [compost metagenome]
MAQRLDHAGHGHEVGRDDEHLRARGPEQVEVRGHDRALAALRLSDLVDVAACIISEAAWHRRVRNHAHLRRHQRDAPLRQLHTDRAASQRIGFVGRRHEAREVAHQRSEAFARRSRCGGAGGRDGLEGIRQRSVPEGVEARRQRVHRRPGHQRVHVDEVRRLAAPEVLVGDVASAGDGEAVVGNEELVVHAPVHAADLVQRQQHARAQATAAHRQRVEDAHLDVGVRGQPGQHLVVSARVQVVDQQAHAHAALRRVAQLAQELPPRAVWGHHVVLHVDGVPCGLRECDACVEGLIAAR